MGLVVNGRRGVEVELRLPDAAADEIVDATVPLPPAPTPRGPDSGRPPRGPRNRFRKPLLIGGGVFAMLVVVAGISGGGDDEDARTSTVSAAVPALRPAPTTTPVATVAPEPTDDDPDPDPTVDLDRNAVAAPDPTTRAVDPPVAQPAQEADPEPVGEVYYENCDAVRDAGAAPIRSGQPGYRSGLDGDGDGQGCGAD